MKGYINAILIIILLLPLIALAQQSAHDKFMAGEDFYLSRAYKEARDEYEKAKVLYEEVEEWDSVAVCIINTGYAFVGERDYEAAASYLGEYTKKLEEFDGLDSFLLAKYYSFSAFLQVILSNYDDALSFYKQAISIYEDIEVNHYNVAYAYKGAAQIYMRRLDYPNVFDCLNKALVCDSTHEYTAGIYSLMALSEFHLGNNQKVLEYCELGLNVPTIRTVEEAMLSGTKGDALFALGQIDEAEVLFNEAYQMYTRPVHWDERASLLNSLAAIAKKNDQEQKAVSYYHEALEEIDNYHPEKCRERADILVQMGHFEMEKGNIGYALSYFQNAVKQLTANFDGKHIWDNPNPEYFYPEPWIMTALAAKAAALIKKYDQEHCLEDLMAAGETYVLALEEVDVLRSTYGEEQAKLYIGDYVYDFVEAAIEANYLLFDVTNDRNYLNEVFRLIEKSKAYVLKEALQQHEAILLSNIPETIKHEEQKLRAIKADVAKELAMVRLGGEEENKEDIATLESKLLKAAEAYSYFLKQVAEKHPQYGASLVDPDDLSVSKIQTEELQNSSLLIEFFWGENAVYIYWLSKTETGAYKIEDINGLETNLKQFLAYLTDRRKFPEDPKGFHKQATELYNRLGLAPLLERQGADKLLIVTDGLLSYLPFEALVSSASPYTNGQWEFLLKNFNIQYAYTASMLFNSGSVPKQLEGILKVSPGFEANERGLATLRYGKQETGKMNIATILEGESATLSSFQQAAGRYKAIHLSTHGEVEQNTNIPKVEFIDKTMLLPEIYALKLQADLVVLSACETGIGALQKGEGVMSLARGFVFSGAKSLVSSMWKVNEQSTASIFSQFYEYLSEGNTKAEALRRAKLYYLDTVESDAEVSPYFWAGFIFLGNDNKLDISGTSNWVYILFGGFLLIAGGYWVNKKLFKKRNLNKFLI